MKLNILLLCDRPQSGSNANTIIDHIDSISKYSSHTVRTYSNLGEINSSLNLDRFDVIIIHYSLSLLYDTYLSANSKYRLKQFKGLKVVFVQDEYREINKLISQLQYLEIDVFFTCFPEQEMRRVYTSSELPHISLYSNLTGYIPERLLGQTNIPLIKDRPMHVVYRGRKLPYWYGELGYEKWNIVEKWKNLVSNPDFNVDLSYHESERIYGEKWIEFITSSKATLGVESGASVMDFTGELQKIVESYQASYPEHDFFQVRQLFFKELDGLYKLNQISPRCFEAIALKTALILYEGEYSGVLIPDRHFIVLKKDFSNIEQVLEKLGNDDFLQNMVEIAYQEIALNPQYSYQNFIKSFDEIVIKEFHNRNKTCVAYPYSSTEFINAIEFIIVKVQIQNDVRKHFSKTFSKLISKIFYMVPRKWRSILKIFVPSILVRRIGRHLL